MPAIMDIQSLPTELLRKIFFHVREGNNGQESIKQCRLVSRCFSNAASPFLITEVSVCLTLESFARFENICRHPIFSKNVQTVIVILSYYEAELACNRQSYMEEARGRLLRHVETMERVRGYRRKFDLTDDRFSWLSNLAWGPSPEMDQLINGEMDEKSSTPIQKLFSKAYDLYQQKYENQERLRQNEAHISRLCAALCSLSNLVSLYLKDDKSWGSDKLAAADFVDTGFGPTVLHHFDSTIHKSRWCGSFQTTHSAIPPLEMLGSLCSQLGENGLRPRALWFSLMPPPNMKVWTLSSTQQANLKQLVSQSTNLKLDVDFFSRHHSLSENPRHEMLALCSITQPFFSASNLERMYITFREYPGSYRTPNVSLGDILPLDMSWPRLQTLHLRHIPATIKELELLVSRHSTTVHDFLWISGWLLEGSWADAFDTIRGFQALEDARLKFPSGGDDGIKDLEYKLPADEIRSYLLRETDNHPLYNITEKPLEDNEHW